MDSAGRELTVDQVAAREVLGQRPSLSLVIAGGAQGQAMALAKRGRIGRREVGSYTQQFQGDVRSRIIIRRSIPTSGRVSTLWRRSTRLGTIGTGR